MKQELQNALPVAECFSRLLHPFAEVVVHDLEKDEIEAIYNPFSKREVGDSSYLDRWDFTVDPSETVIGPYEKVNFDGRRLKCISLVLRDEQGRAVGFVCVNMDISVFEGYQSVIQTFLDNNDGTITEVQSRLFKDDAYEQINGFIQDYCKKACLSLEALKREDKKDLIAALNEAGAFKTKNASAYVSRVLNVSRATVYNYLKETEK